MSQRRLGEVLHIVGLDLSVSGLSRLEKGDRPVTVDELVLIGEVLDIAPADLLEQETIVTGTGDLRMRLEERHEHAPQEPEAPAEPTPLFDPSVLAAIESLAIGAELRAMMQLLASTTVTRSQGEQFRLILGGTGPDLAAKLGAMEQTGRVARRHTRHEHDHGPVARRA
jgi:transcriptional regulator with XRE-family HTH domain